MNASSATPLSHSTIDHGEVDKFSRIAATWWNEDGPFAPLHRLNPVRLAYVRQKIVQHFGRDERSLKPFTGLEIVDIGCGGGLVCEPLNRLGASITGLDADAEAVGIAKLHAAEAGIEVAYRTGTGESLVAENRTFDVVLALEIVEHVADVEAFIASLKELLKPGGLLIMSTLNRTKRSFLSAIVGAEYVLRWLPRGTHEWRRFLKPSELARVLRAHELVVNDVTGMSYDPISRRFALSASDLAVNYLLTARL